MAGNRSRTGHPRTRETRLTNRREARARHLERVASADTASQRVAAAADYLRSALRAAPTEQADRVAAETVADLIRTADALLTPKPTRRTR